MNASNTQVGGDHYAKMGDYQPWDVLQHWLTPEEYRGYQKGVIIAYLAREKAKGGDQDIRKAAHHLQKLCEVISDSGGLIEPAPTAPDTNRELHWIDWNGGKRPVNHNQHVVIQTKNGNHEEGLAEDFDWQHFRSESDIIKYAVAEERDACAFACETLHAPESCTGVERSLWDVATLACADAIRARKKP